MPSTQVFVTVAAMSKSAALAGANALDPVHWDYRGIASTEFQTAALYEYARCCPWVVAYWEKWLKSFIPGVSRSAWAPPVSDRTRTVRVGEALRKGYPRGLPLNDKPDPVADLLIGSFPLFLRRVGLAPLLLRAPQFPKPWLELTPGARKRLVKQVPIGVARLRAFRDVVKVPLGDEMPYEQALKAGKGKVPGDVTFHVAVDFSQALECIQADFDRWLQQKRATLREAGAIPKRLPHRGRTVEINYDALTWLACYNFRAARISYGAARAATQARRSAIPVVDPRVPMPHYSQDSVWSANTSRAKRLMGRLFITPMDRPSNPPPPWWNSARTSISQIPPVDVVNYLVP